jgi:hypothetical protein
VARFSRKFDQFCVGQVCQAQLERILRADELHSKCERGAVDRVMQDPQLRVGTRIAAAAHFITVTEEVCRGT